MTSRPRAKKSLGQNFLVDAGQQRRIVAALDPQPGDTVLEIGPGQGALTRHLVGCVAKLVLVELDDTLAAALETEFAGRSDVEIVHADFMDLDLRTIVRVMSDLKVVGNIPYNITTPIIFRLLERPHRPRCMVLTIQREVADRIVAEPGTPEYGALSVGVRSVARVERLFNIGRGAFRPVPRVDSTVIRITPLVPPPLSERQESDMRELTRTTFSWRRKQLQKTLRSAPRYMLDVDEIQTITALTGLDMQQRPEQLSPGQFLALADALRSVERP
jgi:16S rRNA (adenine1518-N6/adenine1519-N6)-dimethyltransferase